MFKGRCGASFFVIETSHDLAQLSTELVRKGNDFPTVWGTVLKGNALVDGIPQSNLEGTRPGLEVRLITGERLVFDGEAKNSVSNSTPATSTP